MTVAASDTSLPALERLGRRPWVFLAGVGAWLACLAWLRPLMLPDEGRYAGVAWEMLRSGSHAVPRLDGMPYFHKPPLFYWLAELAYRAAGAHPWTARLPSWLGAWLCCIGFYAFLRRRQGAVAAAASVLVLATMPLFYGAAQFANLDMLVAGLIACCVLAGAETVLRAGEGRPARRMALLAAACAALAVLAKGLIGLVLPGAALLAWMTALRDWRGLRALLWPPAVALFLALAVPWFWLVQSRYPGFADYFFMTQQFRRYAETGYNNAQPFWFYLPVLAGGSVPWFLWAGAGLRRACRDAEDGRALRALMLSWLGVVLVFFSLPASKLVGYVLPALPPLAWLLAQGVRHACKGASARPRRRAHATVAAAAALCAALVVAAAAVEQPDARAAGAVLRERMAPGDTLVSFGTYPFDMPLYARLASSIWVVDDWHDPGIDRHDNWRKELRDAAAFDPGQGARVLLSAAQLRGRACSAPEGTRYWIWGDPGHAAGLGLLDGAEPVLRDGSRALWLFVPGADFRRRSCGETPTTGSQ